MEFLKDIALPQSAEHIQLLHYLLVLVLFLFIPFVSLHLWGTLLSVVFNRDERDDQGGHYRQLSKDIISFSASKKSLGIILGIAPLIIVILIYSQIFQATESSFLDYLAASVILIIVALIFNYAYSKTLSFIAGLAGVLILFISLWFFTAGISFALFYEFWMPEGLIGALFSSVVIIRFLLLLVTSLAVACSGILFASFYLDEAKGIENEEYGKFIRSKIVNITLVSLLLIPLLLFANLIIVPQSFLSGAVFAYTVIGLILIFLALHFLYMIFARFSNKYTALLFFTVLFVVLSVIISDQMVVNNATKMHSAVLAVQYEEILADLKGESGPEILSGKEIYDVRCAACHKFDTKLVGPAHNDVVPKYFSKEDLLLAFIKNPTKIDDNFPPMPNPGLKPAEAKAVADYVLEQVKLNMEK